MKLRGITNLTLSRDKTTRWQALNMFKLWYFCAVVTTTITFADAEIFPTGNCQKYPHAGS